MKDAHLLAALERAVQRYGSTELPPDPAAAELVRPKRERKARRRAPGWVSIGEIEASQSPNTYPRLSRRAIKTRCQQLARTEGGPVLEMQHAGLRTWVRFAPAPTPVGHPATPGDADVVVEKDEGGEEPTPGDAARNGVERD